MASLRSIVAVAMTAAVVAGCSSSASEEPEAEQSPSESSNDGKQQKHGKKNGPVKVPGGVAAPDALSEFVCESNDDGQWSASGTITNGDTNTADYRITVVIAPPDAASGKGRQITLADIEAGESSKFRAKKLPVVSGDGPACTVQVARLR